MLEAYQAELAYLRALARRVAAEHPEIAHLVSERQGDASMERLFEGAALLLARTQQRVADDLPEILHPLFERLWPQYLRPAPAATLLHFATGEDLQQAHRVPADTPIRSIKVEGRACAFRTSTAVDVLPLAISRAELQRPRPADLQLHLHFGMTGGISFDSLRPPELRLQLLAPPETRDTLYLWLAHHLRSIEVRDLEDRPVLELPAEALAPWGLGPEDSLAPYQPTPLPGLRLVEEFFFFRDKFWAFSLRGLDQVPPDALDAGFKVVFRLGAISEELDLLPQHFGLGCTPAINLSNSERLDLEVEDGLTELRVVAPNGGDVYTVERVGGYARQGGVFIDYLRLEAEGASPTDEVTRYQVVRRAGEGSGGEVYVAFVDREGAPQAPGAERISIWMTVTDGTLTAKLGPGDVSVPTSSTPAFLDFQNLGGVRPSAPSAVARGRLWSLLALFASTTQRLEDTEGLRQALRQALPEVSDLPGRLILSVRAESTERLHQRMMHAVRRVYVEVAEDQLGGLGEVYLLGQILHQLYQRPGDRAFAELEIRAQPSGQVFSFS